MTCAQLWTCEQKHKLQYLKKNCYVKSGFQILCAVEEFSSQLIFQGYFSLCNRIEFKLFFTKRLAVYATGKKLHV